MVHKNNIKIQSFITIALFISFLQTLPVQLISQPLADGRSKFLGCGTGSTLWPNLDQYWNQVTPGNDGKWGSVEPVQGQYNWGGLDKIYNYAIGKGFAFKEHTFVWGNQQPSWLSALDSAGKRNAVENWIKLVAQRYPNMAFVDVVNEPFHNPLPVYKTALGGDGKTGWDWVITAFQWARQYCSPGTKLLLNEYNVLHDNTVTNNYKRLADTLKARNLIDGIGIQGHYFEFRSDISSSNTYVYDVNVIKTNLDKLALTGLPIYITEFDIDEPIDVNQVAQYKIYFPIFWSHPAVKGITFWGYVQNDVWDSHPNTYLMLWNGTERPALQWLRSYVLPPFPPILVSPTASVSTPRNPKLIWHSSESATSYGIQVATDSLFSSITFDVTVTDTVLTSFPLTANTKYFWRVNALNNRDTSDYSSVAKFTTGDQISDVNELINIPTKFTLFQNYPNPFNPTTVISYQLPISSFVSLKVYDALGKEVATLINEIKKEGSYTIQFNASNLAGGVYLYRMTANNFAETKKLVLIK